MAGIAFIAQLFAVDPALAAEKLDSTLTVGEIEFGYPSTWLVNTTGDKTSLKCSHGDAEIQFTYTKDSNIDLSSRSAKDRKSSAQAFFLTLLEAFDIEGEIIQVSTENTAASAFAEGSFEQAGSRRFVLAYMSSDQIATYTMMLIGEASSVLDNYSTAEAIWDSRRALREVADKSKLEQAISEAWAVNEVNYTPESYAVLRALINEGGNAPTVFNDPDASQEQVDAAEKELRNAIASLVEAFNPAAYETLDYTSIARRPSDYEQKKWVFWGKVVQVSEGKSQVILRVAINDDYDEIVYVVYDSSITTQRVLEDDHITLYGICVGVYTYTAVRGNSVTIPAMYCEHIEF
ncbi:MAG: FIVAR domain-containing protein [Coriobacteriales bacterium]|nr:FIVAR domain-containing protein [Coriobacteriales bacterium]